MRLICLAHFAKPYGHVLIGGKIPTAGQLARVVGGAETEVQSLLDELENQGVFERSRAGGIQSRRMMRDAAASEKGRKSVKKRWDQDTENTSHSGGPNRLNGNHHIGTLIVQEAEAEAERKSPPKSPSGGQIDFDEWWPFYPRKDAKDAARKSYAAAIKAGATPEELLSGVKRYPFNRDEPKYIPMPTTWLNQGRWKAELPLQQTATVRTCDPRYFGRAPEVVRALPEPRWSTPEHEAWVEAGHGRIMRLPENCHVG